MNKLLPICVLLSLTTVASAQATASTLHRLTRANTIAEVKVLAVQVDRQVRYVVFKTVRSLKGSPPATFTLRDVDGRMCGSVLHGLVPGSGRLAFLDHGAEATKLTIPSPRALVPLHAEVRDHVTALLSTESRVHLLTKALAAKHPRVRQDAAYALPLLRDLPRAGGDDRDRILVALRTAIGANDKSGASLVFAAQRLRLSAAVDTLLPHYLAGSQRGLDNLLVAAIAGIDSDRAVRRLAKAMPTRPEQQRLAVRLLTRCGGGDARRCLQTLLTSRDAEVQTSAAAALLGHGHSADDIRERAGREVLDAGRQLLKRSNRLRLRSIRSRSIRPGKDD